MGDDARGDLHFRPCPETSTWQQLLDSNRPTPPIAAPFRPKDRRSPSPRCRTARSAEKGRLFYQPPPCTGRLRAGGPCKSPAEISLLSLKNRDLGSSAPPQYRDVGCLHRGRPDRKSTRLNSSHQK